MGGRCWAVIFGILAALAGLNGIASNLIGYYTCYYNYPYNNNCSPYAGYDKLCCSCCGSNCVYDCLPYYTIYSPGSIAAISVSWSLFFVFIVLAHCCRRRAIR